MPSKQEGNTPTPPEITRMISILAPRQPGIPRPIEQIKAAMRVSSEFFSAVQTIEETRENPENPVK
ncbi:MAG: hypothetical protein M1524_02265 [Patescibacteria group bacterium]|nr:hypothetical protein [Patescibacteria group bacterium]